MAVSLHPLHFGPSRGHRRPPSHPPARELPEPQILPGIPPPRLTQLRRQQDDSNKPGNRHGTKPDIQSTTTKRYAHSHNFPIWD